MLNAKAVFSGLPEATASLATFAEPFVEIAFRGILEKKAGITFALQEVINDLYDGFLSNEERSKLRKDGVSPHLRRVPRPPEVELVADPNILLPSYDRRRRSVEFPAWLAQPDGVLAWVSLAHETSGHAILDAYGLERKLRRELRGELSKFRSGKDWIGWFDEAASDALGVLNLGPAMAVGSIASWRAYGQLTQPDGKAQLPCAAFEPGERHPPPVLRAYLMAHVTSLLSFPGAEKVSAVLKDEVRKELAACRCGRQRLEAAELFADVLLARRQRALNGFRFLDLQNWYQSDEEIVGALKKTLLLEELPKKFNAKHHYAAHAIAAAIIASVTSNQARQRVLPNLIRLLRLMYQSPRGQRVRAELGL